MERPFFSIVCPTHDRPECIELLISVIERQTFNNFELIISDNAYNLPCDQIVKQAMKVDDRVKYYRTEGVLGICDSFEAASKHATGKYVMYVEDKTLLYPNALEKIYNVLINNDLDILNFPWDFHIPKEPEQNMIMGEVYYANRSEKVEKIDIDLALKEKFSCEIMLLQLDKEWNYGSILGGVYSKSFIDQIRHISEEGRLFDGIVPDRYVSVLALFLARDDRILFLDDHILIYSSNRRNTLEWGGKEYESGISVFSSSRKGEKYYEEIMFPQIPIAHNILASDFLRAQNTVKKYKDMKTMYTIPRGKVLAIIEKKINQLNMNAEEKNRIKILIESYYASLTKEEKIQYHRKWDSMKTSLVGNRVNYTSIFVKNIDELLALNL